MEKKTQWSRDQILLNDILKGRTPIQGLYFKHAALEDQSRFELLRKHYYEIGAEKGLRPHDIIMEECDANGSWKRADENSWQNQAKYIENLRDNADRIEGPQKAYYEETLMKEIGNFHKLSQRRSALFIDSLESRCDKWAFEKYVPSLIFNDEACTDPVYNEEDLDYMDDRGFDKIYSIFGEFKESTGESPVKSLACSALCQNMFFAAQTCTDFYGKALIHLTELQTRLFLHAKSYNNIIGNLAGKVRDSVLTDWKALENWSKGTEKQKEVMEGQWSNHDDGGLTMEQIRRNAQKKHTQSQQEKMKSMESMLK